MKEITNEELMSLANDDEILKERILDPLNEQDYIHLEDQSIFLTNKGLDFAETYSFE